MLRIFWDRSPINSRPRGVILNGILIGSRCINVFCVATSYKVAVRTGDVRGAGTDANVYIQIFGKQGDTGRLPLRQSENTKNKFEKGRADMFTVEAVDIGKVSVRRRVYF